MSIDTQKPKHKSWHVVREERAQRETLIEEHIKAVIEEVMLKHHTAFKRLALARPEPEHAAG